MAWLQLVEATGVEAPQGAVAIQPPGILFVEFDMRSLLIKAFGLSTILSLFLVVLPNVAAQDQEASSIEMSARAGFDGFYKSEFWVPVQITVSNNGPDVEGRLQIVVGDTFSGDEVVYSSPLSLPSQSSKRLTLFVHLSHLANRLTVQLVNDRDRTIVDVATNNLNWLAVDDLFYGVVSSTPGQLDLLEDMSGSRSSAAVAYLDIAELPEVPAAWNALDVLVFHDVGSDQLTAEQIEALKGWVSTGGQLVVSGGPNWQRTTDALAEFLPVKVTGIESKEDLPGLRTLAGMPFRDPGPYLVTSGSLRSGEILIQDRGLPLLARRDYGRGSVYYLALDPNLAPLVDWDGSEVIWQEIASRTPPLPNWAIGAQNGYAASNAVSSLPTLSLPSAAQLFLYIVFYIVVVGPLNYLVLRRMRRRELAWLTIPGLVLVFSGLALLAGFRLKGNDTIINQMSIVFGHINGEQLRVQSLLGLYSPRRSTYDLSLPGEVVVRPFGANFGGLSGGGNIDAVERDRDIFVKGIRVDVGGVQTFVADGYQPSPAVTGNAVLRSAGNDLLLDLTVQNNGQETLENATVLVGLNAIPLGDLEPGALVTISEPFSTALSSSFGGGMSTSFVPTGPATSPLALNYSTILGTTSYFDDRDAYPRWQLLEALVAEYGAYSNSSQPGTATLIAWSDEEQLDVDLTNSEFEKQTTTLYLLEMPLTQTVIGTQAITVPKALLSWQVLGENGVYDPAISDFYLPPGWIEYEFRPWPEFQFLDINELSVVLRQPEGVPAQPLPRTQLWDWQQDLWVTLDEAEWGQTPVEEFGFYVGPGNAVRIRLQNNGPQGNDILEIYPALTGRLN